MRLSPIPFAEGALTRQRREVKLLLTPDEVDQLKRQPEWGASRHPAPETSVVSVYFDRPDRSLTARALFHPERCLKLRTKEYAPDRCAAGGRPKVVLEAKREHLGTTRKRRVWIERARLGTPGGAGLQGLLTGGALSPVLAVSYRRRIYQHSGAWRITEDRQIAFHTLAPARALGPDKLLPELLDAPIGREERVVLEVKFTEAAGLPDWLSTLCAQRGAAYSKFAEGMRTLSLATSAGWGGDHGEEASGRVH